jgi:hypothetical protein
MLFLPNVSGTTIPEQNYLKYSLLIELKSIYMK